MALDISVALCTRNGERYLPAQVRSICTQDRLPREIILSDDGSSDHSVEQVRQTLLDCGVADAIALTIFQNAKPLGVTCNFEQALRACRGDLIALSDQDDIWHPGRLARMVALFETQSDLLLLHSDARLVDAQGLPLGRTLFQALEVKPFELAAIAEGRGFEVLMRRNLVTGATTVFRRNLLASALPFPSEWIHDEWLAVIAAAMGRTAVLNEALIDYRQHAANQIGASHPTLLGNFRKAMARRGDKYVKRLRRAQVLLDRMQVLQSEIPSDFVTMQREKVAHQRFRAELPELRRERVVPVLREALRGRYGRFGRGKQAIAQDLLERSG